MKSFYLLVCISLLACTGTRQSAGNSPEPSLVPHGKLGSSLFQQRAAEYQALCIQAYNLARLRLDEAIARGGTRPMAVVTDIDETFLDNSPYAVHRALKGLDYDSPSWQEWTDRGNADTLPGALAFFNYAASKNVEVFYITNRKESEKTGTMQNLVRFRFPFADERHLILRKDSSSKESRRQLVSATHEIVLLLGDNLADFSKLFDSKTGPQRHQAVQQLASEFGKKFIILPNANYGGWEDAVYGNQYNLSPAQKDSAIKSNLKGY